MSLTLWLIRHGQTTINAGEWSCNPEEACLTFLGKQQAMAAALQVERQPDLIIVSPLVRAQESALFLSQRWPSSTLNIWPIQEFIYLSPLKLQKVDQMSRRQLIESYWSRSDPFFRHGNDTESFSSFLKRVASFHNQLANLEGFIIVVGHGQFFKAYQLGLKFGFDPSESWMRMYRQEELSNPIKNSEIIKIIFAK